LELERGRRDSAARVTLNSLELNQRASQWDGELSFFDAPAAAT
jgi:hypothetical protein